MQKARGHGLLRSRSLQASGFRFSFTPLTGVLFTFPSRYWYTIGRRRVLSLGGWAPQIPTRFHVPRGTQVPAASLSISGTRLSLAMAALSKALPLPTRKSPVPALQPRLDESSRFGLFPVRSPLLGESRLISFPSGTEMFHFPELASAHYVFMCR